MEKLSEDINKFEKEYAAIITEKDSCIVSRDEAKVELIGVDEKLNRGQRQQQEQQTNIKHYETETSNIVSRLQALYPELDNQRNKISEMEEQIAHYEAQVDTFQSRRDTLEQQVEEARNEVRAMEETQRTGGTP